jgi:hypothetical protein
MSLSQPIEDEKTNVMSRAFVFCSWIAKTDDELHELIPERLHAVIDQDSDSLGASLATGTSTPSAGTAVVVGVSSTLGVTTVTMAKFVS